MSLQDLFDNSIFGSLVFKTGGNAARFIPIFLYDKSKFGNFVLKTGECCPFFPITFETFLRLLGSSARMIRMSLQDLSLTIRYLQGLRWKKGEKCCPFSKDFVYVKSGFVSFVLKTWGNVAHFSLEVLETTRLLDFLNRMIRMSLQDLFKQFDICMFCVETRAKCCLFFQVVFLTSRFFGARFFLARVKCCPFFLDNFWDNSTVRFLNRVTRCQCLPTFFFCRHFDAAFFLCWNRFFFFFFFFFSKKGFMTICFWKFCVNNWGNAAHFSTNMSETTRSLDFSNRVARCQCLPGPFLDNSILGSFGVLKQGKFLGELAAYYFVLEALGTNIYKHGLVSKKTWEEHAAVHPVLSTKLPNIELSQEKHKIHQTNCLEVDILICN